MLKIAGALSLLDDSASGDDAEESKPEAGHRPCRADKIGALPLTLDGFGDTPL
jgi:hypothetical protein